MKVIVLGAGVTGVTCAWYLAAAGHEVEVIERRSEAGLETSFANGGQISVSHPEPWANPGAPLQILRWLGREDAPLKFRPRADAAQWLWGLRFLMQCLPGRSELNGAAIAALALDSRARLRALRHDYGIEYENLETGILHLFFDRRAFAGAPQRARWLRHLGIAVDVLDQAQCIAVEPALADCRDTLVGALYAVDDESGDAHAFTLRLAQACRQRGVAFRYDTTVEHIAAGADRVTALRLRGADVSADVSADSYVLCAGSYSPLLATDIGERLPIYPVKGYSVTLPLGEGGVAPRVSITDESRRIVCSRLGQRLRAAGTAELNGYDLSINAARCNAILERTRELYPALPASGPPEFWTGLRPATPDNLPIIGRSARRNLYYCTGHGTLGWTLACGSAHALAEMVSGRKPDIAFPLRGL